MTGALVIVSRAGPGPVGARGGCGARAAGWDAAGARWFGYPTFWVNRLGHPAEELGATADGAGRSLSDLVEFVMAGR